MKATQQRSTTQAPTASLARGNEQGRTVRSPVGRPERLIPPRKARQPSHHRNGAQCSEAVTRAAGGGLARVRWEVPVRISATGLADQLMVGDLYYRGPRPPHVVQVLLAGATYNRRYWHPGPNDPRSYVNAATAAGYATLAVDRVGTGQSSKPASDRLDLTATATAVTDLIATLRTGIAGHRFTTVILVGHSLGGAVTWLAGQNADAIMVSSELHSMNHTAWHQIQVHPANTEHRFAHLGLDDGYITTAPGTRGMFHARHVEDNIVLADEHSKDIATLAELHQAETLIDSADAPSSPSATLTCPVLVATGEHDAFFGIDRRDADDLREREAPYYPQAASLDVVVLPGAGHSLNLQHNAPAFHRVAFDWLARVLRRVPCT